MNAVLADDRVALIPLESLTDTKIDETDRRVLIGLFSFCAIGLWRCCVSEFQLGERLPGLTENQLRRSVTVLRTMGWLHLEPRGQGGMEFVMHIPSRLGKSS